MAHYEYEALRDDEVRVVELLPALRYEDAIDIRIFIIPRDCLRASNSKPSPLDLTLDPTGNPRSHFEPSNAIAAQYRKEREESHLHVSSQQVSRVDEGNGTTDTNTLRDTPSAAFIRCRDAFEIHALSYTWGSEEDLLEINVFGSGNAASRDVTHLLVTRNLAEALHHLRANRPMYLWIDALCINQKDDAEKSIQVANMSGIYSNVDNVIVWLGTEDEDSMDGFHYFRYRGRNVEVDFSTGELHAVTGTGEPELADMNMVVLVRSEQWKAIHALINRPWFSRLWIHQEIALARRATVVLGSCAYPWNVFVSGFVSFWMKSKTFEDDRDGDEVFEYRMKLDHISHVCRLSLVPERLINIVVEARRAHCKGPRDKLFAIRSLSPRIAQWVVPDYTESTTQVYMDAFRRSIQCDGNLWMLERAELLTAGEDTPTWLTNWAVPSATRMDSFQYADMENPILPSVSLIDGSVLRVSGRRLATINGGHAISTDMFRYGEKRMLDSLTALMENLKISRVPTTGHVSIASLIRVLYLDGEGIVVRAFGAPLASDTPHLPGAISLDVHARISLVGRHLKSAKLFFTSTGDIGVGPSDARDGDILCFFLGALAPTTLRRVDDTSQYQVVGTCWTEQVLDDGTYFGLLADGWDQSPKESVVLDATMPRTGGRRDNESTGEYRHMETFTYDPEKNNDADGSKKDPRLTPEYFRARGHDIRDFDLV